MKFKTTHHVLQHHVVEERINLMEVTLDIELKDPSQKIEGTSEFNYESSEDGEESILLGEFVDHDKSKLFLPMSNHRHRYSSNKFSSRQGMLLVVFSLYSLRLIIPWLWHGPGLAIFVPVASPVLPRRRSLANSREIIRHSFSCNIWIINALSRHASI